MRLYLNTIFVALILLVLPAFAFAQDFTEGYWVATEVSCFDVSIPIENMSSSDKKENSLLIALNISYDKKCTLYLSNIEYPAVLQNGSEKSGYVSVENCIFPLKMNKDGSLSLLLKDEFIVKLEKKENEPKNLDYLKIEDILVAEEREEKLLKAKEEAEKAALAAIKPASVYGMEVSFDSYDTQKMSLYMDYGRYYFENNTMIGMAYDKSGFLPNLVKCEIIMDGETPRQDAFTVLDRHVNANFLTKYKGYLYYIRVDRDNGMSSLARIDLKTDRVALIGRDMREMAYLQIYDDRIWYTGDEHRLYSCSLDGMENRLELDKAVYDPYFLTEDWLIYQDEEDSETLHIRCMQDGTDLKLTDSRSFNPVVDGTILFFTSIPDDGGKAYLSRIDLSKPIKDGDMCYQIEKSTLPMSKSFYIFNSVIYGENNSSISIDNWKKMKNNAWELIEQRNFYIGKDFSVYGEMYSDHDTVSYLYLYSRDSEEKVLFRHVY